MNHKTRQNIIIYGSLLLAILLLCYAAKDFYGDKSSKEPILKEFEEMIVKKKDDNNDNEAKEEEPDNLKSVDKLSVIDKYIDDILNRRINNDVLTYDVVSTWSSYEVYDIIYLKKITDDYFAYDVMVKINNIEANDLNKKNNKLSTDDYIVINLEFDLALKNDEFVVKNIKK